MKVRFASMTFGLAVGVTVAVLAACAGGAYIFSAHHFETLLETARATALAEGEMIRAALEHQMIENDRTLIARMIDSFGRQPRIERVTLLDRYGVERYSSGSAPPGNDLHIDSPTCQACHRLPPDQRGSSRVIDTQGGSVLRTVVPIPNRRECHACHDPKHKINGVLILDSNAGEMRSELTADLGRMVAATAALALLLISAIALVIRIFVMRRLRRVETAARQIAAGDLNRRVPAEGTDTVSWLAREFNIMAESVTGLYGQVRTQQERLETVINSIDDGIVVLDPKRTIVAANDAFLQRARQSREQVLGCCCRDVAPAACGAGDCPTLACLRSGGRQFRICERRTPDGAVAWEEVHASPIRDTAGTLVHVVEVWRDITERRAAEAHLAESHRLASLGMLASGFSHEINTPLATVLTCVESILREIPAERHDGIDQERIRESASTAREQILRCRGITQHFLHMSRGQRSAADIVNLHTTVAAVVRLVEPAARAVSVRVDVQPISPDLCVRVDEAELQHALLNLLLNAIQASKPGGKVVVSGESGEGDGTVAIRVSDDGCGIAAENLRRIFEPFFSLRKGGTGLGLFLSLNFVRHWGGDIVVDSAAGKGSVFAIVLPALGDSPNPEAAQ